MASKTWKYRIHLQSQRKSATLFPVPGPNNRIAHSPLSDPLDYSLSCLRSPITPFSPSIIHPTSYLPAERWLQPWYSRSQTREFLLASATLCEPSLAFFCVCGLPTNEQPHNPFQKTDKNIFSRIQPSPQINCFSHYFKPLHQPGIFNSKRTEIS